MPARISRDPHDWCDKVQFVLQALCPSNSIEQRHGRAGDRLRHGPPVALLANHSRTPSRARPRRDKLSLRVPAHLISLALFRARAVTICGVGHAPIGRMSSDRVWAEGAIRERESIAAGWSPSPSPLAADVLAPTHRPPRLPLRWRRPASGLFDHGIVALPRNPEREPQPPFSGVAFQLCRSLGPNAHSHRSAAMRPQGRRSNSVG